MHMPPPQQQWLYAVALISLILPGCISNKSGDVYQQVQTRPDATLRDFVGTFAWEAALSDLRPPYTTIRDALKHAAIWPNDHFEVRFDAQNRLIFFGAPLPDDGVERNFPFPLAYTPDQYTLADGWLHLPTRQHGGEAAWVIIGRGETRFSLGLDANGDLIVRSEFDVAGWGLPFPTWILRQEASVFPRLEPPRK